jgi:hypothetical protein
MLSKILQSTAVLVCVLLISVTADAGVVGSWDISAKVTEKITIKGEGSSAERLDTVDLFVFGQDQSFDMLELPAGSGIWSYVDSKMTKFAVYLDNGVLETYWTDKLEELLWNEGINADVENFTLTKNDFTGKQNIKKDTIKGKWIVMFEAYLYIWNVDMGFDIKVKATTNFTGVRNTTVGAFMLESSQPDELSDGGSERTLMEGVCNRIKIAIRGDEPE